MELSTLAQRRLAKGRDSEALQLLQHAVASAPWHAEPVLQIAHLLLNTLQASRGQEGGGGEGGGGLRDNTHDIKASEVREYTEVLRMLETVLDLNPTHSESQKLYGEILWDAGVYEGANVMLKAAVVENPGDYCSLLKIVAIDKNQVLTCVAVCCSILHCVAVGVVCCSVLKTLLKTVALVTNRGLICVAVWCSVMECVAVWYSKLCCVAVLCCVLLCVDILTDIHRNAVLQCIAVCCSVLQHVAVCGHTHRHISWCLIRRRCCSVLRCVAACCSMLQRVDALTDTYYGA